MRNAWHNIRYALRTLAKNPGFTSIAVLTLALGIGANTAIFSVVYGALLSPLPFPNPDQLVMVWSTVRGHNNSVSAGDYLDWKRQNSTFQDLMAFTGGSFSLSGSGTPEVVQTRILSPGWFDLQGIPFFLGRDFTADEGTVGRDHVVVMTHQIWKERFGADPQIIGHEVRLDGHPYLVVGVLAAGMPDRFESQLFVPLAFKPEQLNHDFHWLLVMGRLKPGVSLQQSNADMKGVAERVAETYPLSNKGWGVEVEPLKNDFTSRDTIKHLWLLTGAVGFVLLIACVNVANLLLARGTVRQKEVAVRASLGATRGQLFSQFLTEGLVLAIIGGALGITLATLMLRVILILLPQYSLPTEADIRINLPVLFFSLAATLIAGLLSGSAPAWRISAQNLSDSLKEGGRAFANAGRQGLRRWLVIVEFALALTLLAGAGLAIHSFWKLTHAELGFRSDHVLTAYLPIPAERLTQPKQITAFYRQLLAKISAQPGIASAAVSTGAPIVGTNDSMPFSVAGQPVNDRASRPSAGFAMVTPDYFRTFGIAIATGRGFTEQDVEDGMPVAIVSETFAKRYLAGLDPLRQRLVIEQLIPGADRLGPPMEWQIVGVSRDFRNDSVRRESAPEITVPFWQSPWSAARIDVRTSGDPSSVTNSVAMAVQSMDADLAMAQVRTMDQIVDESLAGDRFAASLFAAFAAVALILAAIGIYGVMSFVVAQRTHEIGLRMALGAGQRQVLDMVLREGMLLAGSGLLLGLAGAYAVGRMMKSILYGISAIDPLAIGIMAAVLALSAALACYLPARRATRVDPLVALRHD